MDSQDSARVRDRLASDRTLLAWLRTGVSLAGLGFVVAKFGLFLDKLDRATRRSAGPRSIHFSGYLGVALVLIGALVMTVGFVQHRQTLRQEGTRPDAPRPPEWPVLLATAGCLAASVVLAGYLLASSSG